MKNPGSLCLHLLLVGYAVALTLRFIIVAQTFIVKKEQSQQMTWAQYFGIEVFV